MCRPDAFDLDVIQLRSWCAFVRSSRIYGVLSLTPKVSVHRKVYEPPRLGERGGGVRSSSSIINSEPELARRGWVPRTKNLRPRSEMHPRTLLFAKLGCCTAMYVLPSLDPYGLVTRGIMANV